jgi:hypothetical protein
MKRDHLPLLGVVVALVVFALAAARYPGGYDWANYTISALFQPRALNGAENPARPLAVLAIFIFCVSVGVVFKSISRRGKSRFQKKTIEIAGIGSMVYAFLVVTPMHDLLVGVALLFFVTAMLVTLRVVYLERRSVMLYAGIGCLALSLSNAVMYYGNVLLGFLPIVQKISIAMWAGWLFAMGARGEGAPGPGGSSRAPDRGRRPSRPRSDGSPGPA